MPIERDRASMVSSEDLIAADRRARGEDRLVTPRGSRRGERTGRRRTVIVVGPIERGLTRTMVRDVSGVTNRVHRASATDVPMASTRRGGRSGWRTGTRQSATPRTPGDPTARQAVRRVMDEDHARTTTSNYRGQRATRNGTTRWEP